MKQQSAKNKAIFQISLANAGLTQREFADRLKVDHSMISRIVRGERKSKRLQREINKFMRRQLRQLNINPAILES